MTTKPPVFATFQCPDTGVVVVAEFNEGHQSMTRRVMIDVDRFDGDHVISDEDMRATKAWCLAAMQTCRRLEVETAEDLMSVLVDGHGATWDDVASLGEE